MRPHFPYDLALLGAAAAGAAMGPALPWLLGAGAAAALLHVRAAMHPRSRLYMPVIWRLPPDSDGIALTFDDGPHDRHTPAVLDLLARHGQRGTFFVVGANVAGRGALLRRIRAEGHTLGIHSFSHSRTFNCHGSRWIQDDIARCAQAIADATGEPPPRLFRPPVGLKSPAVDAAVRRLGLVTVTWTARGYDTVDRDGARIARRLLAGLGRGSILLLHDGTEPGRRGDRAVTEAVLARLLPELAHRGLRSRALALGAGDAPALV